MSIIPVIIVGVVVPTALPLGLSIPVWVAFTVFTALAIRRIWAVSLQIDDSGVLVRNLFREYKLGWMEMRSVAVDAASTESEAITFEARVRSKVTAFGSTFDALMPALHALTPYTDQYAVPVEMSDKIRRKFSKYSKKLEEANGRSS